MGGNSSHKPWAPRQPPIESGVLGSLTDSRDLLLGSVHCTGATAESGTAPRLPDIGSGRREDPGSRRKVALACPGVARSAWEVAHNPDEVKAAAGRFFASGADRVVVKAQVLVGGRGKAGGVKLAATPDEARAVGSSILGMDIKGITVRKVLVGAAADIVKSTTSAPIIDRASRRIVLMASAEGGVRSRRWPARTRARSTASRRS